MSEYHLIATCANCERENMRILARGWCSACYGRWRYWGRPPGGPPPPVKSKDLEGHLEDYDFLVSTGVTSTSELARRLGVCRSTICRYKKIRNGGG